MKVLFWPFFTASSTELSSLRNSTSNAASSPLTSFDVIFSKSFCIMISLNLVLISRSVRSRSVGLSEESKRVTRGKTNWTHGTFYTGILQTGYSAESQILIVLPPDSSSAGENSGDCKAQFRFPVVYERHQLNAPNPV